MIVLYSGHLLLVTLKGVVITIMKNVSIFFDYIARFMLIVGGAVLLLSMVLISFDGIFRYALSKPIPGAFEISGVLLCIIVGLFICYAEYKGAHVEVTALTRFLPSRIKNVVKIIDRFLILIVVGLFAWRSVINTIAGVSINEGKAAFVLIPVWPGRIALSLGFVLICLFEIYQLVQMFMGKREPEKNHALEF
jgi:TRAP-type C4-dicarboxylate transport system permease small subunit